MTSTTLSSDTKRETEILNKVFRRIIPFVIVMIFLSYVDRANLAVLADPIDQSLGMSATAFGFATGLFFWGYVIFEIPSNVALMKYGSRAWLARIMVSWGLITTLMFFAQNEVQFGILRFLLGVAEAGLSPGLLLFITMWFPRSKQVRPLAFFQIAIPIGMLFGNLLTSGLLALFENIVGADGWRWVFMTEGIITIAVGIVVFLTLASTPKQAKWLSSDDADFLTERIEAERNSSGPDPYAHLSEMQRVGMALRSGRAWYLALIYLAVLTGFWAITFFLPQIVGRGFGTTAVQSGVVSALPWAFALLAILVVGRLARTTQRPAMWVGGLQTFAFSGLILAALATNPYVELVGITIALMGVQASLPLFYRLQTHLYTSAMMTAVLLALVNSVGNFGGFIGPSIFGFSYDTFGNDTPALILMGGFLLLAAIAVFLSPRVLQTKTDGRRTTPVVADEQENQAEVAGTPKN